MTLLFCTRVQKWGRGKGENDINRGVMNRWALSKRANNPFPELESTIRRQYEAFGVHRLHLPLYETTALSSNKFREDGVTLIIRTPGKWMHEVKQLLKQAPISDLWNFLFIRAGLKTGRNACRVDGNNSPSFIIFYNCKCFGKGNNATCSAYWNSFR